MKLFVKDKYLEESVKKAHKNQVVDYSTLKDEEIQGIIERMCTYQRLKTKIEKKIE